MIVSYTQDDGSVERLSTDDLSALEAAAIEEAVGERWWHVENLLRSEDPTALRAVLWAVRRRKDKDLKFADFDVPGWRRRLKCRITRAEIDDSLNGLMREALAKSEDSGIEAMLPTLRRLADDVNDVDAALTDLGKGHLVRDRQGSGA